MEKVAYLEVDGQVQLIVELSLQLINDPSTLLVRSHKHRDVHTY